MNSYELGNLLACKQTEVGELRVQLAGKETEVLHLAGKVLLVEQQLAKRNAEIATMKAEKFEAGNNQTILMVRISELRQQVTLLRSTIHKAMGTCFDRQSYERCMADPTYFINKTLAATEPK